MAEDMLSAISVILQDRDLPFDRHGIEIALKDPENSAAFKQWMDEYLSPDTLLTKAELASLSKTKSEHLVSETNLTAIPALNEHEIRTAIEELQRSTAAIDKQNENLKLQQSALNALVSKEKITRDNRSQTDKILQKKWELEKNQISLAVTELCESLNHQSADIEQQSKVTEQSLRALVADILKSDDKLLLSLQKLASDLDEGQTTQDVLAPKVKDLCTKLIKYTVERVRTRLDRIYLETLSASPTDNGGSVSDQDVEDLQGELESLYSEILPVTQMSVEQNYLEPALGIMSSSNSQGQVRTVKAFQYIQNCLNFLILRTETLLQHVDESQNHRVAMESVLKMMKRDLEQYGADLREIVPDRDKTQRDRGSAEISNRSVRRTRPRSSGQGDEDLEPEKHLSRALGISLPAQSETLDTHVDFMEKVLSERVMRLGGHAVNLQTATESSVSTRLLDAHTMLEQLQDALLVDTIYNKVQLLDSQLETAVANLENDIDDIQDQLERADLNVLQGRNVHRDQFVQRWTR